MPCAYDARAARAARGGAHDAPSVSPSGTRDNVSERGQPANMPGLARRPGATRLTGRHCPGERSIRCARRADRAASLPNLGAPVHLRMRITQPCVRVAHTRALAECQLALPTRPDPRWRRAHESPSWLTTQRRTARTTRDRMRGCDSASGQRTARIHTREARFNN
jgi:hypothetical protein